MSAPPALGSAAGSRPLRVGRPTGAGCRDTEWLSSFIMCVWALVLAAPGDSLAGPSFSAFHRLGLTETVWSCAFGATGGLRLAALYINGRSPRTPYARMLGAFFGFLSWGQVGFLVYDGTMQALGVVSPGVAVYGVLSAMELRSLYRASYDARYVTR
ncbi:hypothetical protein D3273_24825 [Lichenibacterium minor]|uniref:DUF4345 domain-containing protein n=1 Tax=Lichenibacterium minor TaxID=2316528 RepID=A0A4Q2TYU3_9HYPH|nr:hypothetical protein [Lichenibacterium minor]RYC29282.1 hypothetical protein D3273_24825 [Lichenibacterium minor]